MPNGVDIKGVITREYLEVLTPEAVGFVAELARRFEPARRDLLQKRVFRQRELNDGCLPDFLPSTRAVRESDWKAAPLPADLQKRWVEITGPVDRKMIVNALNSGADVFMADFEDSNSPTWHNNVQGQINLRDAVRRTLSFKSPEGKPYALAERTAVLMVRPRGWHLVEKHLLVDGQAVSASFFDFGLFFFHNAKELLARGTGPYFYLPKMESYLEARLWNDVFNFAQETLGLPRGTIKATVLIETILAAFEMNEIIHELKDHIAGLNCGRWDYIFSVIKKFRARPKFVLPDRSEITMDKAFLAAYVALLIRTCHRRGVHAMGGMAAQIPIKNDPEANARALEKVRQDKLREAAAGHDGTWVAHPALVPIAREIFEKALRGKPNQLDQLREDVNVGPADLLQIPEGRITEKGLRTNIGVGIRYLEAWLRGQGCVPINHLMEDAATAEICRSQVWQWLHTGAKTEDGRPVTAERVRAAVDEELEAIRSAPERPESAALGKASELFLEMATGPEFPEFLTLSAYAHID